MKANTTSASVQKVAIDLAKLIEEYKLKIEEAKNFINQPNEKANENANVEVRLTPVPVTTS